MMMMMMMMMMKQRERIALGEARGESGEMFGQDSTQEKDVRPSST